MSGNPASSCQIHTVEQWGLKYWTLEYQTHWNTKPFEVRISNVSVLEWTVIAIAIAMVPAIQKLNHWKSEQNDHHFFMLVLLRRTSFLDTLVLYFNHHYTLQFTGFMPALGSCSGFPVFCSVVLNPHIGLPPFCLDFPWQWRLLFECAARTRIP